MKIQLKVVGSKVETKTYQDRKTGNERKVNLAMISGVVDGENIVCNIYGDSIDTFQNLPQTGNVIVDIYRYENINSFMGNCFARSYQICK